MSSRFDQSQAQQIAEEAASQVEAYLEAHPKFLTDYLEAHPEVLFSLVPPAQRTSGNVLDLQHFMIAKLQGEIQALKETQRQLIAASHSNMSSQEQVHRAVLMLLAASTFEHFLQIVTDELPQLLELEAITLCVESLEEPLPEVSTNGVYALPPGGVDRLVGADHDFALYSDVVGEERIFGSRAPFVRSEALIRLRFSHTAPMGLLALGSRDPDMFHSDQGTELLLFFARTLERCIRQWLDLPQG